MESPKIFKQIAPITCPHCNKEVFIGTQAMMPSVSSVSTIDDIKDVKNKIKERLQDISFLTPEERQQVIDYLNDENTLLDGSDIESLIRQVSVDQAQKISNK
jgi:hypothetical protein